MHAVYCKAANNYAGALQSRLKANRCHQIKKNYFYPNSLFLWYEILEKLVTSVYNTSLLPQIQFFGKLKFDIYQAILIIGPRFANS